MKKGVFVLLILGILAVSLGFASAFWPFDLFKKGITGNVVDGTSISDSTTCTDSDGGIYSDIAGKVTFKSGIGKRTIKDACVSKKKLDDDTEKVIEYYCNRRTISSTQINCDADAVCKETPEGATCIKNSADETFIDYAKYDGLPLETKAQAIAEAKALDKKSAIYWSPLPDSKQYGLNQDVTKQEYYAALKNNWEKQKQSLLDELELQDKYGVFNDGADRTEYDAYIAELKAAWDEQEKSQQWNTPAEADEIISSSGSSGSRAFVSSSSGNSGYGNNFASTKDKSEGNIVNLGPGACNGGWGEEILYPTYKIDKKKCPGLYNIFPNGISLSSQSKMYEYQGYYTDDEYICKEVLSSVYTSKQDIAAFCESCPERDISMLRVNNHLSKFEDYRNCVIQGPTLVNKLVFKETITYTNSNILNCNYYDKYVEKADCKPYKGIYRCGIDEGVKATTHYITPSFDDLPCIETFPPKPDAVDQPVASLIYFDVSAECKAPENKKCGSLCCAKDDSCQTSVPVCCPKGYKIDHGICVVDCPKNLKSCTWGCCQKNEICGTAGFCITNKKCPAGTSDCPANDPDDNAKDCCKTDGSETCMSTGGIYEVYFCGANSCNPTTQELCKIELPPKAPKLPIPNKFAICCDIGKCDHFPNGQPYCKTSNSAQSSESSETSSSSKSSMPSEKLSIWKRILNTLKIE
ncbi:MAG: hypothetical protein AABX07_01055 [Nanoarchaeota archaeon]